MLQKGHTFHSVGFTPTGDWVALLEGNGYYTSNVKLPACQKLAELQEGKTPSSAPLSPPPAAGPFCGIKTVTGRKARIPDDAFKKMQEVVKGGGTLRSVAFGPRGAGCCCSTRPASGAETSPTTWAKFSTTP